MSHIFTSFIPLVATAALIVKVIDFLKYVSARNVNGAVTQLIVWVAGVGGIELLAHTSFASGIMVGSQPLSALGAASLILVGMSVSSTGSFAIDVKQAVDQTDSSVKPVLLNPQPRAAAKPAAPPAA